jgi:hypothetical protein
MRAGIMPLLPAFAPFATALTYFSAERVTAVQSLLARAIFRLLGWETFRDQVSTLGTHDPGAVRFAEATLRHLPPGIVPWKDIRRVLFGVFADHSERQEEDKRLWLLRFLCAFPLVEEKCVFLDYK